MSTKCGRTGCQGHAIHRCAKCGVAYCDDHLVLCETQPGAFWCPECDHYVRSLALRKAAEGRRAPR